MYRLFDITLRSSTRMATMLGGKSVHYNMGGNAVYCFSHVCGRKYDEQLEATVKQRY